MFPSMPPCVLKIVSVLMKTNVSDIVSYTRVVNDSTERLRVVIVRLHAVIVGVVRGTHRVSHVVREIESL